MMETHVYHVSVFILYQSNVSLRKIDLIEFAIQRTPSFISFWINMNRNLEFINIKLNLQKCPFVKLFFIRAEMNGSITGVGILCLCSLRSKSFVLNWIHRKVWKCYKYWFGWLWPSRFMCDIFAWIHSLNDPLGSCVYTLHFRVLNGLATEMK